MPLNPSSLQSDLEALFGDPPSTAYLAAQAWGDAVRGYAAGVVPVSTTVSTAASALQASLQASFGSPSAASSIDTAFMTFATAVGVGMLPLFTGIVPPHPLGIATLLSGTQPTHASAAAAFSSLIDGWLRTGSATLVLPPNTLVPAWS